MTKYINLINQYKSQTQDENLIALLNSCITLLKKGVMPTDARIKYSLLLESDVLLDDTTDFNNLELIKSAKCNEIDTTTSNAIISLVGNEVNQRNITAKAIQLTLKVINGTITNEEQSLLNDYNDRFTQVEQLRINGNNKEAEIRATNNTEEFNNKCNELSV